MGIFIDNNGKLKNVLLIKAFSLSFLFVMFFVVGYLISAGFISQKMPKETAGFLGVWGPPSLIAIFAALLCSLLMALFDDKVIVPVAFLYIALYYAILLGGAFLSSKEDQRFASLAMVNIYALPPALWGNLVSWGLFFLVFRRPKRRRR